MEYNKTAWITCPSRFLIVNFCKEFVKGNPKRFHQRNDVTRLWFVDVSLPIIHRFFFTLFESFSSIKSIDKTNSKCLFLKNFRLFSKNFQKRIVFELLYFEKESRIVWK